jgi:hypothetical protein
MSRGAFQVEIDVSRVERLAGRLQDLGGEDFGRMAVRVVNEVADETYDLARPRMIERINLTDQYVRDRMSVRHATNPDAPRASVVASGSRAALTTLARYDGRQAVKQVNWSNASIAGMGKTFGRWPGWTRRIGDERRGIAPDSKGDGSTVQVTRGSTKGLSKTFFMPLRNSDAMGIFMRTGKGDKDYKHLYGPSVYQLFAYTAGQILEQVGDNLEDRVATEAERLLEKALT